MTVQDVKFVVIVAVFAKIELENAQDVMESKIGRASCRERG